MFDKDAEVLSYQVEMRTQQTGFWKDAGFFEPGYNKVTSYKSRRFLWLRWTSKKTIIENESVARTLARAKAISCAKAYRRDGRDDRDVRVRVSVKWKGNKSFCNWLVWKNGEWKD
jgi:hypothetical protein